MEAVENLQSQFISNGVISLGGHVYLKSTFGGYRNIVDVISKNEYQFMIADLDESTHL